MVRDTGGTRVVRGVKGGTGGTGSTGLVRGGKRVGVGVLTPI